MTARLAEPLCLRGARALPAIRIQFKRYSSATLAKRGKKLEKVAQANREEAKITASRILDKLREQEAGLTKPKPPHQKEEHPWSRLDKVVTGWGKDSR
jgi:inhibitor of KinA sporulation pathway (predicted exonuclease)